MTMTVNIERAIANQRSDQFLKLTPLLQVSPVTGRSSPVVVVSKMCVVS